MTLNRGVTTDSRWLGSGVTIHTAQAGYGLPRCSASCAAETGETSLAGSGLRGRPGAETAAAPLRRPSGRLIQPRHRGGTGGAPWPIGFAHGRAWRAATRVAVANWSAGMG